MSTTFRFLDLPIELQMKNLEHYHNNSVDLQVCRDCRGMVILYGTRGDDIEVKIDKHLLPTNFGAWDVPAIREQALTAFRNAYSGRINLLHVPECLSNYHTGCQLSTQEQLLRSLSGRTKIIDFGFIIGMNDTKMDHEYLLRATGSMNNTERHELIPYHFPYLNQILDSFFDAYESITLSKELVEALNGNLSYVLTRQEQYMRVLQDRFVWASWQGRNVSLDFTVYVQIDVFDNQIGPCVTPEQPRKFVITTYSERKSLVRRFIVRLRDTRLTRCYLTRLDRSEKPFNRRIVTEIDAPQRVVKPYPLESSIDKVN